MKPAIALTMATGYKCGPPQPKMATQPHVIDMTQHNVKHARQACNCRVLQTCCVRMGGSEPALLVVFLAVSESMLCIQSCLEILQGRC